MSRENAEVYFVAACYHAITFRRVFGEGSIEYRRAVRNMETCRRRWVSLASREARR